MIPAERRHPPRGGQSWLLYVVVLAMCSVCYVALAGEDADTTGIAGSKAWGALQRGGVVMYVILALSIVGLGFIFEAAYISRRNVILPLGTQRRLEQGISDDEAKGLADGSSSIDQIVTAGFRWRNGTNDQIAGAIEELVDEIIWKLKRAARPIGIIANTTPLLGLLGTVIGIIQAFDVVAQQGALGDPGALAGGISKALLTTCFGLIVAIPMLLTYHYLTGRIETLVRHCEILAKQALIMPPGDEG